MDISFAQPPRMFGAFHLGMLAGILIVCVLVFLRIRRWREKSLLRFIFILGVLMVLLELWKQWFVWEYVYVHEVNLWFFPWQFCSMAMYCAVLTGLCRGKFRDTLLVFLSGFSMFAAIVALAVPSDMLRVQILFASHGFLYHGIMILEALAAMLALRQRQARFRPAVWLFLGMAAVAEVVNVVSHQLLHDIHREPNMFYITPYYPTTQVVFRDIALRLGILPEIVIYLSAIIAFSYGIYRLERALVARSGGAGDCAGCGPKDPEAASKEDAPR